MKETRCIRRRSAHGCVISSVLAVAADLAAVAAHAQPPVWKPEKHVGVIVALAPGGGNENAKDDPADLAGVIPLLWAVRDLGF